MGLIRDARSSLARLATQAAGYLSQPTEGERPKRADLKAQSVTLQRTDFSVYSTAAGLTPQTVVTALREANAGQIRRLVELLEEVEEKDAHIAGVLQTRKLSVVNSDWEILPASDDPLDLRIAETCDRMLKSLPDLDRVLLDLLDAIYKPIAAQEIEWSIRQDRDWSRPLNWPGNLWWVHPKRLGWNTIYEGVQGLDLGELRVLTDAAPTTGERLKPDKFVLHQSRGRSSWPFRAGVGRSLLLIYLYKIYAVKDWATFAELWAQPMRWAELSPSASPDSDRSALQNALADLGNEAVAIVSAGTKLNLLSQANSGGDKVYSLLCDYLDAQATKAVLGHSGASDATAGIGQGGADNTALSTTQAIRQADARALEATLRRDLLGAFVRLNWPEALVPYFHLKVEPPANLRADAERYEILVRSGFSVPKAWAHEQQGIPLPADGEAVLEQPQAAQDAPFFPGLPSLPTDTTPDQKPVDVAPVASPDVALNGAQVTALLDVIARVVEKQLPRESAIEIIISAFGINREQVERLLGPVGRTFEPAPPPDAAPAGEVAASARPFGWSADDDDRQSEAYAPGPLLSAQQTESLVRNSLRRAGPLWEQLTEPVTAALSEATTWEEAQARLAAVGLDTTTIADLLAQAKLTAQLLGRAQVANEVGLALAKVGTDVEPVKDEEALRWINSKRPMPYAEFQAVDAKTKAKAFALAEQESVYVVDAVRQKIAAAIDEGQSYGAFRSDLGAMYDEIGITERSPWHTETVFRNAVGQSAQVGRYREMTDPDVLKMRPYWQYRTVGDAAVRMAHRAMDGRVYRADDPIWRTWAPPNGHACRCTIVSLSRSDVERRGLKVEALPPEVDGAPARPDPGFDTNPAFDE